MKAFDLSGIRGAARYLRQRSASVSKPHKRAILDSYADEIDVASAHIEKLEKAIERKK